ncbi:MAG: response regulator [Candidatus Obscuribacterales bacterium]|nr:response regulator [Candidatus Obscuribacterales bacterium]
MIIQKILIVDDDPNIRMIAQTSIEGLTDWQVLTATTGVEALEVVASQMPDLILLDVRMPEMDGLTALKHLQENPQTTLIPVIFITANVQTHEIEAYIRSGAKGVICKPFDPLALPDHIRSFVQ